MLQSIQLFCGNKNPQATTHDCALASSANRYAQSYAWQRWVKFKLNADQFVVARFCVLASPSALYSLSFKVY